jgi:eukaryotic-like serine/threonine-protein kinase
MKHFFLCFALFLMIASCNKPGSNARLSSDNTITSFVFKAANNNGLTTDITGQIGQDSVKLVLPHGSSLNSLTPEITFTGKEITPAGKTAQDFTNPVRYTITAEDGTQKTYIAVAKIIADSARSITSFIFKAANNPALTADVAGNIGSDSIKVYVPYGTNITSLTPTISINGVTISPASLTAQNFSGTISYTITAEDGTTRNYKVVVYVQPLASTLFINCTNFFPTITTGRIYAIDANTGLLNWKYTISNTANVASPTFSNGILYTGLLHNISAFDTATKSMKWEYTTGGFVESTPTVANGVVYANSNDGALYAVDIATGNLKWKYAQYPGDSIGPGNFSSPTVINGVVYFGSMNGYVYAVDAANGNLKWSTYDSAGYKAGFQASPSVVNGVLYIADLYHNLLALDTRDGSIKWSYMTLGPVFASPTVVNGVVYVCTGGINNGELNAIDAASGTLKWKFISPVPNLTASPIVSNGVLYMASNGPNIGVLYAVNIADGSLKWSYTTDHGFSSSPVVYNGAVYLANYARVIAVDAATGLLKWKFTADTGIGDIFASPCIVDQLGNIYESTISGDKN